MSELCYCGIGRRMLESGIDTAALIDVMKDML
jgi:hypothetical protein